MPASTPNEILNLDEVSKIFGALTAVSHVSLGISKGSIYALIGPNGAGKTTLLKLIVGLLKPTSGSICINTYDISRDPVRAKQQFGYVSDDPVPYEYLTGREFLGMTGRLRGLTDEECDTRIDELIRLFPLKDVIHETISHYSRGNKQKIAFLSAILTKPPLLIIDEPIVGLDPQSIDIFGNLIKKYGKEGGTVLMATHTLWFAKTYANHVAVIHKGKIITVKEIRESLKLESLVPEENL